MLHGSQMPVDGVGRFWEGSLCKLDRRGRHPSAGTTRLVLVLGKALAERMLKIEIDGHLSAECWLRWSSTEKATLRHDPLSHMLWNSKATRCAGYYKAPAVLPAPALPLVCVQLN
jgi:hypothetical protein